MQIDCADIIFFPMILKINTDVTTVISEQRQTKEIDINHNLHSNISAFYMCNFFQANYYKDV